MTSVLDKLNKILQLEQEQGHRDKAVIGGLARFAGNWRQQALREIDNVDWVNYIAEHMRVYSQWGTRTERRASLEALRAAIRSGPGGEILPIKRPPQAPTPKPATQQPRPATQQPKPITQRREPARPPVPAPPPAPAAHKQRPVVASKRTPARQDAALDSPLTTLSGIGPVQSKRLARLGLRVIRDALYFFPRRYDDFSALKTINQLEYGEQVTIMGQVWHTTTRRTRSGKIITTAIIQDKSGTIQVTWFNQPHLSSQLKPLRQIVLSGRVEEYLGRLTFQSPQWEPLDRELLHTARLVPVYPLTEGISARSMRKLLKNTVDYWSTRVPEHLPSQVLQNVGLLDLQTALQQTHFPKDPETLAQARYRLAFDEIFSIQIGMLRRRQQWQSEPGQPLDIDADALQRFILGLPFTPTGAQQRALDEIVQDLRRERPMNRLLQGDVGSGKTVVATAAMVLAVAAGAQAALMAPTEILAEQHYHTIKGLLGTDPAAPDVQLLTGSTPQAAKQTIYQGLSDGAISIVIGTHALIQEGVQFQRLALAVVDEQHRFGVTQRSALRQKGYNPHLLVMTATPIPRSLALTLHGDLDLSLIDEMPPGRQTIQTRVLLPTERERAYAFVRGQIERGRQAFIICPLVEESEKVEAKAAVEEHQRLQEQVFPDLRLGLLHGRLKGAEKETVMGQFAQGELDILVSTSVVEVGIDVPNASVMLIEGANRFGLAQLHQFRGRVGRGEHRSYCLLIADSTTAVSQERLQAIEQTQDGFVLAETDLKLRGPGEFFGTRQSGLPDLRLADVADIRLLETARREAQRLFDDDPNLASPELRLLLQQVERFWAQGETS